MGGSSGQNTSGRHRSGVPAQADNESLGVAQVSLPQSAYSTSLPLSPYDSFIRHTRRCDRRREDVMDDGSALFAPATMTPSVEASPRVWGGRVLCVPKTR